MYTGTLISDLMNTAERVSNMAEQVSNLAEQQIKQELHEIFTMQVSIDDSNQVYQGAA